MAIEPCPNGSHVRELYLHEKLWLALNTVCDALPWLNMVLPVDCNSLAPDMHDLDTLCLEPPPELPELDWLAIASSGPSFTNFGLLVNWIRTFQWQQQWANYCECNEVSGSGTCPPVAKWTVADTSGGAHGLHPVGPFQDCPHGWTAVTATAWNNDTTGSLTTIYARFYDAAQTTVLGQLSLTPDLNSSATTINYSATLAGITTAEMADLRYVRMWIQPSGGIVAHSMSLELSAFQGLCDDVTYTPDPPELPPDPTRPPELPDYPGPPECTESTICALLMAVVQELQRVGQLAGIIQKYGYPFATVPGTSHGPLTGSGSLTIVDLVGMQVVIESGEQPRVLEGAPLYQWDLGWMSIMTPDGMIEEKRITRMVETWQPRMMQEATTFGYWLKEGVEATFVEQVPEGY